MGFRAYRINRIDYKKDPTFSLGGELLWQFLNSESPGDLNGSLNDGGSSIIDIAVEVLEKAIMHPELFEDDLEKEGIAKDIIRAKRKGDDWVQYYVL